ncbi:MAG: hypothetical protein ACJ75Z_10165 [Solirubrobacterales bacterium]
MGRGLAVLTVAGLTLAGAIAGCGDGHTFSASEFVNRINAEGVTVQLGQRLPTGGGADQLYAIRLPPLPGESPPPPGSEGGPGASGTLYVYGDSGGAADKLDACRAAGGLGCFRASNVVVVLNEESGPLEARRLAVAIRRLGES